MTAMAQRPHGLIERLPSVRGRYAENVPLARTTWFRTGGNAEVTFRPVDRDDLAHFMARRPRDVAVTVMGVASNLLVRDGGIDGVVIRLGRGFAGIEVTEDRVTAGATALDINVALSAAKANLAGFEFLGGVPGTIGGALRMNAGAYGREVKDILIEASAIDGRGEEQRLNAADMGFSYRRCAIAEDWIFTGCTLRGEPGDRRQIAARMEEIATARHATQPIRSRTGGSTFKNPNDPAAGGKKAWQLIDEAGCRSLTRGGAQVSEQHCNFLINTGTASSADLEGLGEEVRQRVLDHSGVSLEWEIRRIGQPLAVDSTANGRIAP